MSFTQAVNSCFLKFLTFTGRAPRSEYWFFYLFVQLAFGMLYLLGLALQGSGRTNGDALILLHILAAVALIPPNISVTIRRLHDTGRSGFWILAPIAPLPFFIYLILALEDALSFLTFSGNEDVAFYALAILGLAWIAILIALFVFMVIPGDPKANQFGPSPLHSTSAMKSGLRGEPDVKAVQSVAKVEEENTDWEVEPDAQNTVIPENAYRWADAVITNEKSELMSQVEMPPKNNDVDDKAQKYTETAFKVMEYRSDARRVWGNIQELPEQYHGRFLEALGKDPGSDLHELEAKFFDEYQKVLRPYEDDLANDALEDVRTIGPEAEAEFIEVYEMLADSVPLEELINQIESKFGPTMKTIEREKREEEERLAEEQRRRDAELAAEEQRRQEHERQQKSEEETRRQIEAAKQIQASQESFEGKLCDTTSAPDPEPQPEPNKKRRKRRQSFITIAIGFAGAVLYVAVQTGEPSNSIRDTDLNKTQRTVAEVALQTAGYGPLEVDGYFDPVTIRAIRAWQKKNNFNADGKLTVEQFNKLLQR